MTTTRTTTPGRISHHTAPNGTDVELWITYRSEARYQVRCDDTKRNFPDEQEAHEYYARMVLQAVTGKYQFG